VTELETAQNAIGEPVEAGLWLRRERHRWYHDISSGTELDLILLALAMPFVIWNFLFRDPRKKKRTGPVYVALTSTQLVFFDATDGIIRRGLKEIYDRRDLDDVGVCLMNGKILQIILSDSDRLMLHFDGPHSEIEAFVAKAT